MKKKKQENRVNIRITARCKKYPKGTKQEDIDSGKVKPYSDTIKECEVDANDRRV